MKLKITLLFMLTAITAIGAVISISPGWTLLGTPHAITTLPNESEVGILWKYSGGRWYASHDYNRSDIGLLTRLEAGDGFWVNRRESSIASWTLTDIPSSQYDLNLTAGWNLVSFDANETPLWKLTGASIDMAWRYRNGGWQFYTSDPVLHQSVAERALYPLFTTISSYEGVWVRAPKSVSVAFRAPLCDPLTNLYDGSPYFTVCLPPFEQMSVASAMYPSGNGYRWLKNGAIPTDNLLSADDNLTLDASAIARFVDKEDVNLTLIPVNQGSSLTPMTPQIVSVQFPKFKEFLLNGSTGPQQLRINDFSPVEVIVSLRDTANRPIPNTAVILNVPEVEQSNFSVRQVMTDRDGNAKFRYMPNLMTEKSFDINASFYNAANIKKTSHNVTIVMSGTTIATWPDGSVIVTEPSQSQLIEFLVLDREGRAVVNREITLLPFPLKYGRLSAVTVRTDEAGYASFTYTSPSVLPIAEAVDLNMTSGVLTKSLRFIFSQPTRNYTISGDTNLTVSELSSSIPVRVQVIDNDTQRPVAGTTVRVKAGTFTGSINSFEATTDANGYASFTYTAPAQFPAGGSTHLSFVLDANSSVEKNITISFQHTQQTLVTLANVVFQPSEIVVTSPQQSVSIKAYALTSDDTAIDANLTLPILYDSVGTDYGAFTVRNTETQNGEVTLTFVSPKKQPDQNITANIVITAGSSVITKTIPIRYHYESDYRTTSYVAALDFNGKLSVEPESLQTFVVKIVDAANSSSYADPSNVMTLRLISLDPDILQFKDGSDTNITLSYSGTSSKTILPVTFGRSGIARVKVEADLNITGNVVAMQAQTFSIPILSGPASLISLVYQSGRFVSPFYEDTYVVHAVDRYGNPVNRGDKIVLSVINSFKFVDDSNESNTSTYLTNGSIYKENSATWLETSVGDFRNLAKGDRIAIVANAQRSNPIYLGGWTVADEGNVTSTKLKLRETLASDENITGISFLLGNEKRYSPCDRTNYTADFDVDGTDYTLDENGNLTFRLRYDPYMVGKDVILMANIENATGRIGVSLVRTLKGTGITSPVMHCEDTNTSGPTECSFTPVVTLRDSAELFKNGRVSSYNCVAGDCNTAIITRTFTGCSGTIDLHVRSESTATMTMTYNELMVGDIGPEYDFN